MDAAPVDPEFEAVFAVAVTEDILAAVESGVEDVDWIEDIAAASVAAASAAGSVAASDSPVDFVVASAV